jgi:hypothetical protein
MRRCQITAGGGGQQFGYAHLIPIAKLPIERGHHLPLHRRSKFGFGSRPGRVVCDLSRTITPDDWAAINERFLLPDNIAYYKGLIRDSANGVDFLGCDEIVCDDGLQPISVWEQREREAGRVF